MICSFTMHPVASTERESYDGRVQQFDLYEFDRLDLATVTGLMFSSGVDQLYLQQQADRLTTFLDDGGRILLNGHPVARLLPGLPRWRKLDFHTTDDLRLTAVDDHPIWTGVDRRDLLLRTGVPGEHSFEDLQRIGVAGFYGRSYLADLPDGASVITGIGPNKLPLDVSIPYSGGEIVIHPGNDLLSFAEPYNSTAPLIDNALDWLAADDRRS